VLTSKQLIERQRLVLGDLDHADVAEEFSSSAFQIVQDR